MTEKKLILNILTAALAAGGFDCTCAQTNTGNAGASQNAAGVTQVVGAGLPWVPNNVVLDIPILDIRVLDTDAMGGAINTVSAHKTDFTGAPNQRLGESGLGPVATRKVSFAADVRNRSTGSPRLAGPGTRDGSVGLAGPIGAGQGGGGDRIQGTDPKGSDNGPGSNLALKQLQARVSELKKELATTRGMADLADKLGRDYLGGADEVKARAFERAAELRSQIDVTKKAYHHSALTRYNDLTKELSGLKAERRAAILPARWSPDMAKEYVLTGGAEEAYSRAMEEAGRIQAKIDAVRRKIASLKAAGPAFLDVRYRASSALKNIRRLLGYQDAPRARELQAERVELRRERKLALALAAEPSDVARDYRGGADEVRGRAYEHAAELQREIEAKKQELRKMSSDE